MRYRKKRQFWKLPADRVWKNCTKEEAKQIEKNTNKYEFKDLEKAKAPEKAKIQPKSKKD